MAELKFADRIVQVRSFEILIPVERSSGESYSQETDEGFSSNSPFDGDLTSLLIHPAQFQNNNKFERLW